MFAIVPLLFSFAVLCWVSGFDIIYALQDDAFDKENNLFSMPSTLGRKNALMISTILHIISSSLLFTAIYLGGLDMLVIAGWCVFSGLLFYQHTLVKVQDLKKVNFAFFTTNGIASFVFACFIICDLFWNR